MPKNLIIVESPAKAKTIEGYLGEDFIVKSSFGHVRDLPKDNKAIDIQNNYTPVYEVSADKKNVVAELKKLAKQSSEVWLATDDDREGESISWHLKEALGLKDNTKRIVFREITKKAITQAVQNPRTINVALVDAQQARRILDRLVGFELSPILWSKIERGLSAGRVQSVAVRIVVEREREVLNFQTKFSYKVVAEFISEKKIFKAELNKALETEEEALAFLEKCKTALFTVVKLEKKSVKKSPAPPFTTSTLQQEASRKLSFSVLQTMTVAQKLYESGKITYMRTDSISLSEDALGAAKSAIIQLFDQKYVQSRQYKTKSDSAQEAHEAIRPTDFTVQKAGSDRNEQRLYELIWKRAIASQMADALLDRTIATIDISTAAPHYFTATGEMITFDGFLKLYIESNDDEEEEQEGILPKLSEKQQLNYQTIRAIQRFSRPQPRYTEASLVKRLEELGIGRPSTYAPTISTIIKRDYVVKEDREGQKRKYNELTLLPPDILKKEVKEETFGTEKAKLFPTNTGMVVNDFLVNSFGDVMDYSFTASVEREFDEIAEGKLKWQEMIDNFYKPFHATIEKVSEGTSRQQAATRDLGKDPKTGKNVTVRKGKFGFFVQLGEATETEKPQYASLQKGQLVESISLNEALDLFKLPREVGFYEQKSMIASVGKLGPYIKYDDKYYSLTPQDNPLIITEERAIELILEKQKEIENQTLGLFEGEPMIAGKGRFGPYIKHLDKYYSLPKTVSLSALTVEKALEIIKTKRETESNKVIQEFAENKTVRVLNGIYGPYISIGKRNVKIPKDKDPKTLTLEECLALGKK